MRSSPISNSSANKVAILAFFFSLIFCGFGFLQAAMVNGELCYALDDSFIMMAISKNIAFHHVWGLTQYHFSSTASSPLFTCILAGFIFIFGNHIALPLIINVLALLGLFVWLGQKARAWGMNRWQIWMLLMGLHFFMPIPVLLFGSMEHVLHAWIALICLQQIGENRAKLGHFHLFFMGALLSGIRYEGLFQGGLLVLWLWKNKDWSKGLTLSLGLSFPVLWLGFYSISKGWYFLPNSIILKGYALNIEETKSILGYLASLAEKLIRDPHNLAVLLILGLIRLWGGKKQSLNSSYLDLVFWMCVSHFIFGRYNSVFRYEAYLIGLSWVFIWKYFCLELSIHNFSYFRNFIKNEPQMAILTLLLLYSIGLRSVKSFAAGTRAMVNIYEQQVQAALFVKKFYNSVCIGAVDVGAIAYFSECKLLDIWGLGSIEIARLRLKHRHHLYQMHRVFEKNKMQIAIVYGKGYNYPKWHKSGSWIIKNNTVCDNDTIDFLSVSPFESQPLISNLKSFEPLLPKTVSAIYYP